MLPPLGSTLFDILGAKSRMPREWSFATPWHHEAQWRAERVSTPAAQRTNGAHRASARRLYAAPRRPAGARPGAPEARHARAAAPALQPLPEPKEGARTDVMCRSRCLLRLKGYGLRCRGLLLTSGNACTLRSRNKHAILYAPDTSRNKNTPLPRAFQADPPLRRKPHAAWRAHCRTLCLSAPCRDMHRSAVDFKVGASTISKTHEHKRPRTSYASNSNRGPVRMAAGRVCLRPPSSQGCSGRAAQWRCCERARRPPAEWSRALPPKCHECFIMHFAPQWTPIGNRAKAATESPSLLCAPCDPPCGAAHVHHENMSSQHCARLPLDQALPCTMPPSHVANTCRAPSRAIAYPRGASQSSTSARSRTSLALRNIRLLAFAGVPDGKTVTWPLRPSFCAGDRHEQGVTCGGAA